jgi:hypothetical protein
LEEIEMEMACCDHQDFYDVSDAKCRLPAYLRRLGPKRSASAPGSQLEQRRADAGVTEKAAPSRRSMKCYASPRSV